MVELTASDKVRGEGTAARITGPLPTVKMPAATFILRLGFFFKSDSLLISASANNDLRHRLVRAEELLPELPSTDGDASSYNCETLSGVRMLDNENIYA